MNNIEILEKFVKEYKDKGYFGIIKAEHLQIAENLIKDYKEIEKYANWHIEHLTEDISDYIDDDRKANASIIGEFKEEREHWKDIIRIINNEKTFIDYKNY